MPEEMGDMEFVETDIVSDDDAPEEAHNQLLNAVSQLYKKQRISAPKRCEPAQEISEFNLYSNTEKRSNKVHVNELLKDLQEKVTHKEINSKIKAAQRKSKTLPKPLEKNEADKINREIGYQNVKKKLDRWNTVVERSKLADQLVFPLEQKKVDMEPPNFLKTFKEPTELEKAMAAVLNQSEIAQEERKMEESLNNLSIEEMIERRKMIAKMRARESYRIAKAVRQNKIKSKKYHRILKKERIKQELKDFEKLQKTDPEAALAKLEQIERARAEERISLRHRNTGKWARSRAIRAKYDTEARMQLAEQLSKSRELTRKINVNDSSSSEGEIEDEDHEENDDRNLMTKSMPNSDSANPWVKETVVDEFLNGYKQFWSEKHSSMTGAKESSKLENNEGLLISGENIDLTTLNTDPLPITDNRNLNDNISNIELKETSVSKDLLKNNEVRDTEVISKESFKKSASALSTELLQASDNNNFNDNNLENIESANISITKEFLKYDGLKENSLPHKRILSACDTEVIEKNDCLKQKSNHTSHELNSPLNAIDKNRHAKICTEEFTSSTIGKSNPQVLLRNSGEAIDSISRPEELELKNPRPNVSTHQLLFLTDHSRISEMTHTSNSPQKLFSRPRRSPYCKPKLTSLSSPDKISHSISGSEKLMLSDNEKPSSSTKDSPINRLTVSIQMGNSNNIQNRRSVNKNSENLSDNESNIDLVESSNNLSSSENEAEKVQDTVVTKSGSWAVLNVSSDRKITQNQAKLKKRKMKEKTLNELFDDAEEAIHSHTSAMAKRIRDETLNSVDDSEAVRNGQVKKQLLVKPFRKVGKNNGIDEALMEIHEDGISSGVNDLKNIRDKLTSSENVISKEPQIDPNKHINVKPQKLFSEIGDLEEAGDDSDDNATQKMHLMEAFADDDIADQFRKEKDEEAKNNKSQEINLEMPGWGSWGGSSIPVKSKRKKRRFIVKLPKIPRKDDKKEHVIINEDPVPKLREKLVNELPYPFTSVKDYEASIRAPIGKNWVPEKAFKKLIAPPVITKMGTIIEPMSDSMDFNKKKRRKRLT